MDIKTGLSIYNKPWLVEPSAAMQMLDYWEQVKAGANWDYSKAVKPKTELSQYDIHKKFFAVNGVVAAPESSWDMEEFTGFEGATVAVIPVTGPLMKHDFCGSLGTGSLKALVRMASETPSVRTIVFRVDSPGGTVDGTESFAAEIAASPKTTIAICEGMACSAAYWVSSACDKMYASSRTDSIGCIGTMVTLRDYSGAREKQGVVLREYYATDSGDKNKDVSDAIKGDGKALIENTLDPLNDVFLGAVKANRKNVKESALSGKTYTAVQAQEQGLIDGIKSFEAVLTEAKDQKGIKQTAPTINIIQKTKNSNMTTAEIKAAHPEAYAQIVAEGVKEGVTQERNRTKAWMALMDTDQAAATKGINDGAMVDMSVIAEMSVKAAQKGAIQGAEKDNAPKLDVPASPKAATKDAEPNAVPDAVQSEFMKLCGITK